jgi:hypothetical protein
MPQLEELVGSGRIAEVAIAFMAIEAVVLTRRSIRADRGVPWGLYLNLTAGLMLLLALREALAGSQPYLIPVFLTASLAAHAGDLSLRSEK